MKRKPMTRAEIAQRIWQVLVSAARNRQVLTYELLADLIDMGGPGTLAYPLGCVMAYCRLNRLPALTVLVVNKRKGRPGAGLTNVFDQDAEREKVFNYKWFRLTPPRTADFEDAYRKLE